MKDKTKRRILLVLALILGVQLLMAAGKEGYHMDEILSYELSNSEFTPWITTTQPQGRLQKYYRNEIRKESVGGTLASLWETAVDVVKHRGSSKALSYRADVYEEPVWFTGEEMLAYVTYDREDSVPLLSAYYNSTTDNHPPLYFMAMNLVSLFFGEHFGPWAGILLNLVFFAGILLLIYGIMDRVFSSPKAGIPGMLLYGLSMAGVASTLWIRMYTMLTFFCMLALFLCLTKLRETGDNGGDKDGFVRHNKGMIAAMILGFLTQYFFCIFMFFLAAGVCIVLTCRKAYRHLAGFLRSIVIAAVIGLICYPTAFHDVFHSQMGDAVWGQAAGGFAGMGLRIYTFASIFVKEILGVNGDRAFFMLILSVLLLIVVAVVMIFRFLGRKKTGAGEATGKTESVIALVVFAGYFLVVSAIAPYLSDRYIMPIMPLGVILIMLALTGGKETSEERGPEWSILICVLLLTLPGLAFQRCPYLYTGYEEQVEIAKKHAEEDCLCVYDGYGYYRNVPELILYENSLLVRETELTSRSEDKRLAEDPSLMVICGAGVDEKTVLTFLETNYGFGRSEELLGAGVAGDRIYRVTK